MSNNPAQIDASSPLSKRRQERWRPGVRPSVILFDLDGTLSDSAPGINDSMRYALEHHGFEIPTPEVLRSFVGPPFAVALGSLGYDAETIATIVTTYRSHYASGGMFNNTPYPGIAELLGALKAHGCVVAVATSKPQETARNIIEHFGFDKYLTGGIAAVFGADITKPHDTKADVIGRALAGLGVMPGEDVVMVGDRLHDVEGATAHNIACIGVSWGYAALDELHNAGAILIVDETKQLENALLPSTAI